MLRAITRGIVGRDFDQPYEELCLLDAVRREVIVNRGARIGHRHCLGRKFWMKRRNARVATSASSRVIASAGL